MVTIYGIRNKISFRTYVGCTAGKVSKRMREHRCLLNAGKHKASLLQDEWSKFGPAAFEMVVLEELPDDATTEQKREAEIRNMIALRSVGLLYNDHIISFRPCDEAIRRGVANAQKHPGNRWTAEANEKRRLAQLGKPKGHGAKISATKRARAMR